MPLTLTQKTLAGSVPTLTTTVASSIASTTAISGGNIPSDGGSSVTVVVFVGESPPIQLLTIQKRLTVLGLKFILASKLA